MSREGERFLNTIHRVFRNYPFSSTYGVYSYLDGNESDDYFDSDGLPLQYDKFIGKDLYTTSVNHPINHAILTSHAVAEVEDAYDIFGSYDNNIDHLKYQGNTFVQINNLKIVNRGVNSDINDVYFRFFFFSQAYFDPFEPGTGNLLSYGEIRDGMQIPGQAWFYNQNGPNFNEGGAPGNFPGLQNLGIIESFDFENFGPADVTSGQGDGSIAEVPTFEGGTGTFNPSVSLAKVDGIVNDMGDNTVTTIFQENGAQNDIFFGVHMDGDQDVVFDRSRNQTIDIYRINPAELFNEDGTGKVTTLTFDSPTAERFSSGDRTAAFTCKDLSITINTQGGVVLGENYFVPEMFNSYVDDILPKLEIGTDSSFTKEYIDEIILNMYPSRELDLGLTGLSDDPIYTYYASWAADWIPVTTPFVADRDLQVYYLDKEDRTFGSAPASVGLDFYISLHPFPYESLCNPTTDDWDDIFCYTQLEFTYDPSEDTSYYMPDIGYELIKREYLLEEGYDEYTKIQNWEQTWSYTHEEEDSNYMFFVVDWNDKDNKYNTVEDVLADWPRTKVELLDKKRNNLYIPTTTGNPIKNDYRTPGIKTIKTIMFNYFKGVEGQSGAFYEGLNRIEPLRWKLVTSRIFLDIPISEFPDFGEVGGADYTTIPWPYTTPIIGGISENSKYINSINNILSSGNIGDQDVIDESFLVESIANDEMGKNVEKLDLEQVRYFNSSYDMNRLLNITDESGYVLPTLYTYYWNSGYFDQEGEIEPLYKPFIENENNFWFWETTTNIIHPMGGSGNPYTVKASYPEEASSVSEGTQLNMEHLPKTETGRVIGNLDSEITLNSENYYPTHFAITLGDENKILHNPDYVPTWCNQFAGDSNDCNWEPTDECFYDGSGGANDPYSVENGYPPDLDTGCVQKYIYRAGIICEILPEHINNGDGWIFDGETKNSLIVPLETCNYTDVQGIRYLDDDEEYVSYYNPNGDHQGEPGYERDIGNAYNFRRIQFYSFTYEFYAEGEDPNDNRVFVFDVCSNHEWNVNSGPLDSGNYYCEMGIIPPEHCNQCGTRGGATSWCDDPNRHPDDEWGAWHQENNNSWNYRNVEWQCGGPCSWNSSPDAAPSHDDGDADAICEMVCQHEAEYGTIKGVTGTLSYSASHHADFVGGPEDYFCNGPEGCYDCGSGCGENQPCGPIDPEQAGIYHLDSDLSSGYISQENSTCSLINPNQPWYSFEAHCGGWYLDSTGQQRGGPYPYEMTYCECHINPTVEVEDPNGQIYKLSFTSPTGEQSHFIENPYYALDDDGLPYWNGSSPSRTFPEESSVGEIFISDNIDSNLVDDCQLELNAGNIFGNSIDDTSGKLNKGLLIGDYNIIKTRKNKPMRRDSYIKVPKKNSNKDGAL